MNTIRPVASKFWCISAAMLLSLWANHANSQVPDIAQTSEVHGGLVIQLGESGTRTAAKLSLNDRYLIHVLEVDAEKVDIARERLRKDGHYGLTWAEQARDKGRLPYAENLAKLVMVQDYSVSTTDLKRLFTAGRQSLHQRPTDLCNAEGAFDLNSVNQHPS